MDDTTLSHAITLAAALTFGLSAWATFWIWRARRGGWAKVAMTYPTFGRVRDSMPRRWQSLRMMPGKLDYPGLVTLRMTVQGLHVAAGLPVRFGHEPILVPWDDIEIFAVDTYPADRLYDLSFARTPQVRMRVGVAVAQLIRRAADNSRYFVEPVRGSIPTASTVLRPRVTV